MKLKRLFMMLVLGFTSYIGLTNKHIVKGIISLEIIFIQKNYLKTGYYTMVGKRLIK